MAKRAVIICSPDAFANAVKPKLLQKLLEKYAYDVTLYSTDTLSRAGQSGLLRWLPGALPKQCLLYGYEILHLIAHRSGGRVKKFLASRIMLPILRLRGELLAGRLAGQSFDILICENNFDEAIALHQVAPIQMLDLPAPFAEEMLYGGELTQAAYTAIRNLEIDAYAAADYLSFHWHTYTKFVQKEKYNGPNIIDLGYGTKPKQKQATFAKKPRVVFLGYLAGYWVNIPLLEKLSAHYDIDVYGGPQPPANSKLNYKGYAPTLDVLADYQFGVITITDDPLRRSSFSSKHLEYFSYGLPVLTPVWRPDDVLDDGSIYYDEHNFRQRIEEYSDPAKWQQKHQAAQRLAATLSWEYALQPLEKIIKENV